MKRRRVKITGIGPVTPAGIGVNDFWKGVILSKSYINRLASEDLESVPLVAATVSDAALKPLTTIFGSSRDAARHTEFAVIAADLALENAKIESEEYQKTALCRSRLSVAARLRWHR